MKIQFHRIDTNVVVGLLVREFCCSGTDVSAKVLAMYAGTRTPSMEPQWLAAGLSQINDISDGNSIINSLHRAYDNGIVLRGEIGSETLGYLQMAINCFDEYAAGSFSLYRYQRVLDFLYAFWGCADDCVEDETSRNILKCGRYMERLDLYLRLKMPYSKIEKEYSKLKNRMEKSRLSVNENAKMRLLEILDKKEEWQKEYRDAINSLEGLFII